MAARGPPVPNFDYNNTHITDKIFFEGFGIKDVDTQIAIKARRTEAFREVNPEQVTYHGADGIALQKKHIALMYDKFPEFCDAPGPWKVSAMTYWMTQARTGLKRRKNTREATKRKHFHGDDDDETPVPIKRPRKHPTRDIKDENDENDDLFIVQSIESRPYRESYRESVEKFRSLSLGPSQPHSTQTRAPLSHGPTRIRFATLLHNGVITDDDIITEIELEELMVNSTVLWDKLVSVVETLVGYEGFSFTGRVYLSPRPNQRFAITHQGLLNTAMRDFAPGSTPVCTTSPVPKSNQCSLMNDKSTADKPVEDQDEPQHSGRVGEPTEGQDEDMLDLPDMPDPRYDDAQEEGGDPAVIQQDAGLADIQQDAGLADKQDSGRVDKSKEGQDEDMLEAPTVLDRLRQKSSTRSEYTHEWPERRRLVPGLFDHPSQFGPQESSRRPCKAARVWEPSFPLFEETSSLLPLGDPTSSGPESISSPWTPINKPQSRDTIDLTVNDDEPESPTRNTGTEMPDVAPDNSDFDMDDDLDEEPEAHEEPEADEELKDEEAEEEARQYAFSSETALTAKVSAARTTLENYKRAAKTFCMDLSDLRPTQESPRVPVPARVGLSPGYRAYPHQIVGATEVYMDAFGSKGGCILADEMGFGKTDTILKTYFLNYSAAVKLYGKDPKLTGQKFPPIEDGTVNGVKPRIGATFISASPQGLKAWPQAWSRMMAGSKAMREFPKQWRPKLVILHGDGEMYAQEFGGQENGIYSSMSRNDWAEVLPRPNWNNSREPTQPPHKEAEWQFTGPSNWPEIPGATPDSPTPSSTRYVIVSTNNSWRNYITCTWKPDKKYRALQKEYFAQKNEKGRKPIRDKLQEAMDIWYTKRCRWIDGRGPTQARRPVHVNGRGPKPNWRICDLAFAAWVVIDELHAASAEDTLTYTEVVQVFRTGRPEKDWPGVTGITGSALANGIGTTTAFTAIVLKRSKTKYKPVKRLSDLSSSKLTKAWKKTQTIFKDSLRQPAVRRKKWLERAIAQTPEIRYMNEIFSHIMQHFFILRDYDTRDPWGETLKLINAIHDVRYQDIEFEDKYHNEVVRVEEQVKATVEEKWKEAKREWENKKHPGEEPPRPALHRADPGAYINARILASFPNLLEAIRTWQEKHPDQPRIIGEECEWGFSLGGANKVVYDAIQSERGIRDSFLWEIAEDACKGSAKVDFILEQAKSMRGKLTTMRNDQGEEVSYQSKYVVASGLRLSRALLWCRLVQEFGAKHVVGVASSVDRRDAVPRWQDTNGPVWIMVAALMVICQSITLVEGNIFHVPEPTSKNNDAVQAGNRQYRIGQQQPRVEVRWLVHKDSYIESKIARRNEAKNRFADGVKGATIKDSKAVLNEVVEEVA